VALVAQRELNVTDPVQLCDKRIQALRIEILAALLTEIARC